VIVHPFEVELPKPLNKSYGGLHVHDAPTLVAIVPLLPAKL
jgi:hypothetical protein